MPDPQPPPPLAHALIVEFSRVLSAEEWREVVDHVRRLPVVKRLRADVLRPLVPLKWPA